MRLRARLERLERRQPREDVTVVLWVEDVDGWMLCCNTGERISPEEWERRKAAGGVVALTFGGPDGEDEWARIRRKRLQAARELKDTT